MSYQLSPTNRSQIVSTGDRFVVAVEGDFRGGQLHVLFSIDGQYASQADNGLYVFEAAGLRSYDSNGEDIKLLWIGDAGQVEVTVTDISAGMTGADIEATLDAYYGNANWRSAMDSAEIVAAIDSALGSSAWQVAGMPMPANNTTYQVAYEQGWLALGVVEYYDMSVNGRVIIDSIPTYWGEVSSALFITISPGVSIFSYSLSSALALSYLTIYSLNPVPPYVAAGVTNLSDVTITAPSISSNAFVGLNSLINAFLTVTSIDDYAFSSCNLSFLILNTGLESIGSFAFQNNYTLTIVTFPETLVTIAASAFDSCTNLLTINFAEGLTYIGDAAFRNAAVTTIVLPSTLEELGSNVFDGCVNLSALNVMTDIAPIVGTNAFTGTSLTEVHVPTAATGWGATWAGLTVVQDL
jgi:hypothetical protein